jgi:hypothetical protein
MSTVVQEPTVGGPASAARRSGAARAVAELLYVTSGLSLGVVWFTVLKRLVIEVRDDDHGGAQRTLGSGLEGLAQRVEALDGELVIDSPEGGPTTIRAELPCAS